MVSAIFLPKGTERFKAVLKKVEEILKEIRCAVGKVMDIVIRQKKRIDQAMVGVKYFWFDLEEHRGRIGLAQRRFLGLWTVALTGYERHEIIRCVVVGIRTFVFLLQIKRS